MAAYLYESLVEPDAMPGNNTFVAGLVLYLSTNVTGPAKTKKNVRHYRFFQANVGDTTPNVLGAYCESGPEAGNQCSLEKSLCGGRTEPCQGRCGLFLSSTPLAKNSSWFKVEGSIFVSLSFLYETLPSLM